jgi:hypothetical protein
LPAHEARAVTSPEPSGASAEEIQELVARAVLAYGAAVAAQPDLRPLPAGHEVAQTEVLRLVTALLKEAEVEVFELAMWQLWSRD